MRVCGSGSAPLGKDLAEFYMAIGLPLIEGYGLTEGGVVVMNPLEAPRPGSIGRPLPGVEVRLAEDGELLLRSPSLFSGYYRDPAATAQALRDGWLHTGDLAEIDADGYVHITGRKKELIVASNGSKIFPSRIEALFRMEPVVSHVLVVGDRRPYVTALVTVNTGMVQSLHAPLGEAVKEAVERVNRCLAPFEQIRKFRVLERDFSIEKGELTPTLKLRRSRILENFRDVVRELYGGKDQPV
jgi:long-chain acyl-CoA synthetase